MSATDPSHNEYEDEWPRIYERRRVAFGAPDSAAEKPTERPKDLVGLALSGGGLRSALFNDGLLQAFSHRGLLRYVDYLCSVSGGGYIAGHLMTYANARTAAKQSEPAAPCTPIDFHNDKDSWHFGRDPDTGREDIARLPGIGGYLRRSTQFFAGYCLRQIPVFLLYISFVGLIATFIALYFRSFDEPLFRSVYLTGLDIRFGDELFIAFLPPLSVFFPAVLLAFCGWFPLSSRPEPPKLQKRLRFLAKLFFWVTLFLLASSFAVYLGNDLTKATSNRNVANHNRLNQFALQMTIIAGVVQLLVFFGRDRLFRSEKAEASRWKKITQALIANGVVAFAIFTMIHVMARENISGYTAIRDPYLVLGDVGDWNTLTQLFENFQHRLNAASSSSATADTTQESNPGNHTAPSAALKSLDYSAWVRAHITGESLLHRSMRYAFDSELSALPESPAENRDRRKGDALLSTPARYWYFIRLCTLGRSLKDNRYIPASTSYGELWDVAKQYRAAQEQYLRDHNAILESREFTNLLLDHLLPPDSSKENTATTTVHWSDGSGVVESGVDYLVLDKAVTVSAAKGNSWQRLVEEPHINFQIENMSTNRRSLLRIRLAKHDLNALENSLPIKVNIAGPWPRWESTGDQSWSLRDQVALNHDLLQLVTGADDQSVVRSSDIASTWVVQPHDQATRWRWAFLWASLLGISLVLTSDLNRVSYIFDYYRDAICRAFLLRTRRTGIKAAADHAETYPVHGDTPVGDLLPEKSGLPFPIFLTTWLKGSSRRAVGIIPVPVAITPLGVSVRDDHPCTYKWPDGSAAEKRANSRAKPHREPHHHFSVQDNTTAQNDPAAPITLSNTVAASGAAVSPMMTNTTALALLMDFFGARLGFWWPNPAGRRMWPLQTQLVFFFSLLSLFALLSGYILALPDSWAWLLTAVFAADQIIAPLEAVQSSKYMHQVLAIVATVGCLAGYLMFRNCGYPSLILSRLRTWWQRQTGNPNTPFEEAEATITGYWPNIFLSDGGFCDYLGVTELLRRRCELIIVSDAGINTGSTALESLALMCERASSNLGVQFVDLDHDTPIEFARLHRNESQLAPQPFIAMRVKYPVAEHGTESAHDAGPREGLLFYVQMTITERDPIEIQQIRHRFPSFPDEPTTNQFYTADQVAAYRDLGYHIGKRLCIHLQRWNTKQINEAIGNAIFRTSREIFNFKQEASAHLEAMGIRQLSELRQDFMIMRLRGMRREFQLLKKLGSENPSLQSQPLLPEVMRRLKRAYVQACFEEYYFSEDDVYGESVWRDHRVKSEFPAFQDAAISCFSSHTAPKRGSHALSIKSWLNAFTDQADVFSRYVQAVAHDINCLNSDTPTPSSESANIFLEIVGVTQGTRHNPKPRGTAATAQQLDEYSYSIFQEPWAAHLAAVAAAAQQLHRGTPHAVFQVGGREKLCSLMQNLVEDVGKFFTSNEGVEDTPWESSCGMIAGAMVDEICELAECVFQDAERLAVVSFAQCLCQELASLRPRPYVDFFSTNGDTPRPRPGEFLLPFDFRQLFLEKLQNGYRSHANELITKYLEYLYRLDSGIYIDRRPVIAQKTLAIAPFGTPISRRFDR